MAERNDRSPARQNVSPGKESDPSFFSEFTQRKLHKTVEAQASPPQPLISALAAEQIAQLAAIRDLLALAWHRNKNQHRRSRWWAEFGMLRRGVEKLITATKLGHGAGKDELRLRINFLTEEVFERCWLAFSAVVADNQYAALGLMLLGTLARLGSVLGVKIGFHSEAVVEGEEIAKTASENLGAESREYEEESQSGSVDLGVVLRREELEMEVENTEDVITDAWTDGTKYLNALEYNAESLMPDSEMSASKIASIVKPQRKKKKKKGDEFDELFSSLI